MTKKTLFFTNVDNFDGFSDNEEQTNTCICVVYEYQHSPCSINVLCVAFTMCWQ